MLAHHITLVVHRNVKILETLLHQILDDDLQDRPAGDAEHRLRGVVSEGAQPLSATTGHQENRIGTLRNQQRFFQGPQGNNAAFGVEDRHLPADVPPHHVDNRGRIVVRVRDTRLAVHDRRSDIGNLHAAQQTAPHVAVSHGSQQPSIVVDDQRNLCDGSFDGLDHVLDGRGRPDQCFLNV